MEDLLLSVYEHNLLRKHKSYLEKRYNVVINIPEVGRNVPSFACDVIFANVIGLEENISSVKEFLRRKLDEPIIICEASSSTPNEVTVITLSDSDEDNAVLTETQNTKSKYGSHVKRKKKNKAVTQVNAISSQNLKDENICQISSTTKESAQKRLKPVVEGDFIPLTTTTAHHNQTVTIDEPVTTKIAQHNQTITLDESIIIDETDVTEEESQDPKPIPKDPKLLRPIVIDGSNVARAHGMKENAFSCKGIQIAVEYFLKRGHTEVTAFVPNFRRHRKFGKVPTTNESILEELEKSQHVVFTPSRTISGKRVTCYDDRFIVQLASETGGVILSNDNYKDLIHESPDFKTTIEERLLMFCFVGDKLMPPKDPLGRNGPTLDEFLSFPSS